MHLSSPDCARQVHFGATLPLSLVAVLKAKSPNPQTLRKIALEGHRFTPSEALSLGLVDRTVPGNTDAILAEAQSLAESIDSLPKTGVWGTNRVRVWSVVVPIDAHD